MTLEEGLSKTYAWIDEQVKKENFVQVEVEKMQKQALGVEVTI